MKKKVIDNYQIRIPTEKEPLKILFSSCLLGIECGYNGTSYGSYPWLKKLLHDAKVNAVHFCPEHYAFGTPRAICDIHGGNGVDVLNGKARVLTDQGEDWTDEMIKAANKMLGFAIKENAELAILMDISAACGSQVIYKGSREEENPIYQRGMGVCAAKLKLNDIPVISQRDFASLEALYHLINPNHEIDETKTDHHQTEWYQKYFKQ